MRQIGEWIATHYAWLDQATNGKAPEVLSLGLSTLVAVGAVIAFFWPSANGPQTNVSNNSGIVGGTFKNSPITINQNTTNSPSSVRTKISGKWGPDGCNEESYKISIEKDAIIVDSVLVPTGGRSWHFEGTILTDELNVMNVRGEKPDSAYGRSATLTYFDNGATERLIWDNQGADYEPVKWSRCG